MPTYTPKYQVIYADPPWPESDVNRDKRKRRGLANYYYTTMSGDAILAMGGAVSSLADRDSALLLWSTPRHLPLALQTVEAWGFEFVVVGFTWMKKNKNNGEPFFGMGYYTRSNAEFCLLGRRGSPRPMDKTISSAVYEPRGRHSEKPATVRRRIELLFGNVRRLELFAREETPGWDAWGNEVQSTPYLRKVFGGTAIV